MIFQCIAVQPKAQICPPLASQPEKSHYIERKETKTFNVVNSILKVKNMKKNVFPKY